MQLRRIQVKNIRSYESAEVEFPSGTTLISGDVGSGKTSLLYGIEMALFGVAEVDAAYLVRHGAPHSEVEVEFADDEHRYAIRRRFRRVTRRGRQTFEPERISFTIDGEGTAYSATELRQRVIDLLGFPDNPNPQAHSDLWRWAVYVPQERMRDILSAKPQDRLETVRKALGVERYRIAAENAQELATDLRRSVATVRTEAERLAHHDRDHAQWTDEADRLRLDRSRWEEMIRQREKELDSARTLRAEAERAVREAQTVRTVLDSLRREDESDRRALEEGARARAERVDEAERRRAEADEARPVADELERLRGAREEAESARDKARGQFDELGPRLRELSEARAESAAAARREAEVRIALGRAEQELATARERRDATYAEGPAREPPAPTPLPLAELDQRLAAAQGEERKVLAELTVSRRTLAEIDELLTAGICPRCGQPVRADEFRSHRTEAESAVQAIEAAHRTAEEARERWEAERHARERYERAFERWTEIEKRRALSDAEVDRAESQCRAAADAVGKSAADRERTTRRVETLGPAEEEEREARQALEAAESGLRTAADRYDVSARAAERVRTADAAREAALSEVKRRDRELDGVRRRWEDRRGRIEELSRTLSGADERSAALATAEQRYADAEAALGEARQVLVRVDTRLDEAARRIEEAARGRAERTHLLAEADDLAGKAAWISGPFRTAVLTMEQRLLAHAQASFERSFARYFASLVDDPGLTARTDVAFTPAVTIEDEWTPAEALSGGERTSLALAFRLALAQVVRSMGGLRLDTILLDEPTDGFSPEQVVRMGELLDELALPQIVLVSHETELAAIADRVVRIEKRDGRSMVRAGLEIPATPPSTEPQPAPEPTPRRRPRTRASRSRAPS